jgi:hypothetical protein
MDNAVDAMARALDAYERLLQCRSVLLPQQQLTASEDAREGLADLFSETDRVSELSLALGALLVGDGNAGRDKGDPGQHNERQEPCLGYYRLQRETKEIEQKRCNRDGDGQSRRLMEADVEDRNGKQQRDVMAGNVQQVDRDDRNENKTRQNELGDVAHSGPRVSRLIRAIATSWETKRFTDRHI